jgi:uncharacterized DUF497 family protein
VEFEWDPEKARTNLLKHKVPFLRACDVFKDPGRVERPDVSDDPDEERWIVIGCVEEQILFVVYTQRGERLRLISARSATSNEERIYWTGEIPA